MSVKTKFKYFLFLVWLLHCHIDFHAEVGMALMIKVGEYHEMAPVPKSFPQCFDYKAQSVSDITDSSVTPTISFSLLIFIIFILHI